MSFQELKGLRAVSLLRASSKPQTTKVISDDGSTDYDIPLQRNILTPWIAQLGMEHLEEFVEGGVSGYRVSTENRDKLQKIKQMAIRKEFDVLVIYMSDRLGRIADETPLVVSFLNNHGIKVLSYTEGEIKADTHQDKLMTYIRYWQAEGESLKTSMRVSDALIDQVKAGKWRGGNAAFGYRFVSKGTLNNKGKPIFDVEIIEAEAETVRMIFRMARVENMGTFRIAKHLNDNGFPGQRGGRWRSNGIYQTLKNPIYKGVYVLHSRVKSKPKIVSPPMEQFRIIPDDEWNEVQQIMRERLVGEGGTKKRNHGKLLLSGLLFCGTCGCKLTTFSHTKTYKKKNGEESKYRGYKYVCASLYVPRTDSCTGQTTYVTDKLETAVVADIKDFLATLNTAEIVDGYMAKLDSDARQLNADLQRRRAAMPRLEFELTKLKGEIIRILTGESSFSEAMIKELLLQKETELSELRRAEEYLQAEIQRISDLKCAQLTLTGELSNWSELFDKHELTRRKAMLNNIIDRIDVWSGRVEITYNITLLAFSGAKDSEDCATGDYGINAQNDIINIQNGVSPVSFETGLLYAGGGNGMRSGAELYAPIAPAAPSRLSIHKVREAVYEGNGDKSCWAKEYWAKKKNQAVQVLVN